MDLKKFYDSVRKDIQLTDANVAGFDKVLSYLEQHEDNLQHAANITATAFWETGRTMQPVKEAYWLSEDWRKKNLRYFPYYGRGYVQLTWDYNYKKASDYFGVDFVKNPDLVMKPEYALPILVVGMNEGWFTGKKLSDYIDDIDEDDKEDLREFINARRIVNGTDKQVEIGNLSLVFEKGLKAAGYRLQSTEKPVEPVKEVTAPEVPKEKNALLRFIIKLLEGLIE